MSEEKSCTRSSRRKNSFWARMRRKNIKSVIKLKSLKELKEFEKRFEAQAALERSNED